MKTMKKLVIQNDEYEVVDASARSRLDGHDTEIATINDIIGGASVQGYDAIINVDLDNYDVTVVDGSFISCVTKASAGSPVRIWVGSLAGENSSSYAEYDGQWSFMLAFQPTQSICTFKGLVLDDIIGGVPSYTGFEIQWTNQSIYVSTL